MDDLEGVLDNADGHDLLTVVATVHHERVGQTLDNGALALAEALLVVALSSVVQVLLELILLVESQVVLEKVRSANAKARRRKMKAYPQSVVRNLDSVIGPAQGEI